MKGTFNRYLTEIEEKALMDTVKSRSGDLAARDHAWMRLLRATGIRVGALSRLTCGHARDAIRNDHLVLEPEIQKKKVGHTLFVTKKCKKAFRDLLRIRRKMGHVEQADAPLIMSRNNKGMSKRALQQRTKQWCEAAGLCGVSPHWFRHTVAKRIMQESTAKDPRGVAQGVLGHISIRSTMIYTMPDKEDVEDAMREVC